MWSTNSAADRSFPARGFLTPPASWWSSSLHSPSPGAATGMTMMMMPMSERKKVSPSCKRNLFHVLHKVPPGDSPYTRAKHVQLIEKDPSRAISLFWAAINAGDRVDSALKDMAVVMKQLNRSDEAIEAIKSFRHLCPFESQESLDNVLIELYKRSGRIEEEIEMLQQKLKNVEEGIAFGGKKTKLARSQGKKVQITAEQEKSRILGNLAWAYLQQHNYGLAEQYYRKALALEPDRNKQCNLAICLMHMNRIPEAKSLLQAVRASFGSKEMDESCAKSFERAFQVLTELESHSVLKTVEPVNGNQRSLKPDGRGSFFGSNRGTSNCMPSGWSDGSQPSAQHSDENNWGKFSNLRSPGEMSGPVRKMKESWISPAGKVPNSEHKKTFASPTPVLYTQPRRCSWGFSKGDERRDEWRQNTAKNLTAAVLAQPIDNLNGELLDSPNEKSDTIPAGRDLSRPWRDVASVEPLSQPRSEGQMIDAADTECLGGSSTEPLKKSWADMVEEEEENKYQDENLDINMLQQELKAVDLQDPAGPSRKVRRCLCFEVDKDTKRRTRLQVFREITPSSDSP